MAAERPLLERRRAGVCLHLSSLPGPYGIGALGAAALRFLDWMQAHGLSVWQFLPTGPTGYGNSPYQPLSVFAGNPLLIDLDTLVGWELLRESELRELPASGTGRIDFAVLPGGKLPLLGLAADRLLGSGDDALTGEFERFCASHGDTWLDAYAAFAVLKAENGGRAWPHWSEAERPGREERLGTLMRSRHAAWQRERAIQFLFARQWRQFRREASRRGILLFGDVPIYMALDCAEAWAHPELIALDGNFLPLEVAGVPPDYFSSDGQLWGNPVYRWDEHARTGYRWWIARLGHALGDADLVRLDHFRGFDAYWSIPQGAASAREGRWVPGPAHALFDAFAQAFGRVPVVAEDLGVITGSVTALRRAYGLPGMQVLQFLVDQDGFDRAAIEEDCVCYTGTHDNDTTEGWFAGSAGLVAGEALERLRGVVSHNVEGARESIHKAMINLCFHTRARIAIAPLQDYLGLGSEARLNTPGEPEGNWLWRVSDAVLAKSATDYIAGLAVATGRA